MTSRPYMPTLLQLPMITLAATLGVVACTGSDVTPDSAAIVFEGARLIDGNGGPPIEDAVFVVEGARFVRVGPRADVEIPTGARRVDLSGKTVIPAFVNAHIHLSSDRTERSEQLQQMAFYGAGLVVSLGLDEGPVGLEMRGERVEGGARTLSAGRGITSPEPGRSEIPFWVSTESEARAAVQALAEQNVDIVKIWVDDRGGQYERLSPVLYTAVIDEAHKHGLKVTAHIFRLEDAKGLLSAGIDAFAHSIRDQDVDDALIALWQRHPEVVLVPNLPDPGVSADLDWLNETVPAEQLAPMKATAAEENPQARVAFGIQARNLKRLRDAGVKIAFGTDGSAPWAVHQELEDMVRSGMTPAEVLVAATRTSAELMGLGDEVGTVAEGRSADFVVLNANPLQEISFTRAIAAVWLRGAEVDRDRLKLPGATSR